VTPAEFAEHTAQAQGFPPRVEDPAVLGLVAQLIAHGTPLSPTASQQRTSGGTDERQTQRSRRTRTDRSGQPSEATATTPSMTQS